MLSTSKIKSTNLKQLPKYVSELIRYQQWLAMKNGIQLDSWQALKAGMASTGKVILKSILKPTNLVIAGIATMVTVMHQTNQAIEEVRDRAGELGNSFNEAKSDIEGYKEQIEDLYKTISDSSSSISEVTTARQSLMTIQDELIDKFGDEKETIDLVTDAINNQSSALDTLIEKQWQETKNKFNESNGWNDFGNWRDGYSDNIDRMVDEMENAWANIKMTTSDYHSGKYDDIIQRLEKDGWKYSFSSETFLKGGSTEDLYEEILKIQTLFGEDVPDKFSKSLTKEANELKNILDDYESMWDTYILNDRIFTDDNLADSWKEVNDAYTKYQDAVVTGDATAIEESMVGFATSINKVLDDENVSDSVKDYFKDMYPVLYREVEQWEFKTQVIPKFDAKGLQGKTQADVLAMLQTKGTQDGEKTFNSIVEKAIEYGLIIDDDKDSIQQLLDLLVEWGILQGTITEETENANKFDNSRTKMISSINDLSEGFEELDKIYSSIKDDDPFDFKLLDDDNFKETFSGLDTYADFIEQITSNSDDIEACQSAFNNLVTEWITDTKVLENVTEENEKLTAAMLKQMGIVNADEVAHNALEKAKAKEYVQSKDNINVTEDNINSLINEANTAGVTTNAYLELVAKEILFNDNDINTSSKCEQILAIAKTAGIASTSLSALNSEIANVAGKKIGSGARTEYAQSKGVEVISEKNRTDGKKNGNLYVVDGKEFDDFTEAMQYAEAYNTMQNISSAFSQYTVPTYTGGSKSNSSSSSSKDTKETFDWIETAISRLQREITNFGKTVSATWKSWTDRNSALKSQISSVTSEINLQSDAAKKYETLAKNVSLSETYKRLVRNGALDISTITNENTINAIKQYQEWYRTCHVA